MSEKPEERRREETKGKEEFSSCAAAAARLASLPHFAFFHSARFFFILPEKIKNITSQQAKQRELTMLVIFSGENTTAPKWMRVASSSIIIISFFDIYKYTIYMFFHFSGDSLIVDVSLMLLLSCRFYDGTRTFFPNFSTSLLNDDDDDDVTGPIGGDTEQKKMK